MSKVTHEAGRKPSILVADDSRIMRFAIHRMLADEYQLVEVDNGEKAWQQLLHNDAIKILLTDLQMPVVDGYELIDRLRKPENPEHLREMPVIVLSSFDENEERSKKALSLGKLAYVTKPFNSSQIKERVNALLDEAMQAPGQEPAHAEPVEKAKGLDYFVEKGERDLAYVRRESKDMSTVLFEIDKVPELVVHHGYGVVGQFVVWLNTFLQQQVRTLDTVSRIAQYRFGVILPLTNDLGAVEMAKRVIEKVRTQQFTHQGEPIKFAMSVSIAAPRVHHCQSFVDMLKIAERRLEMAMNFGGNTLIYEDQPYQAQQKAEAEAKENQPQLPDKENDTEKALVIGLPQQAELDKQPVDDSEPDAPKEPTQPADKAVGFRQQKPQVIDFNHYHSAAKTEPGETGAELPGEVASASVTQETPSVETVLWLLKSGHLDLIQPHLPELLKALLPLLRYVDEALSLQANDLIERLNEQLDSGERF